MKLAKRVIEIWFLIFLSIHMYSQEKLFDELELINIIAQYRNQIIGKNVNAVNNLRELEHNLGGFDPQNEEFDWITTSAVYYHSYFSKSPRRILKYVKKVCKNCKLLDKVTEREIAIIVDNVELLDLITAGVLKSTFPYAIDPKSMIEQEMKFYDFESSQKIAEIGAGNGTFSILLAMLSQDIEISINELYYFYLEYIYDKIISNIELLDSTKIELVNGTWKDTKLREDFYDKIIIRNAFHHFSKKNKMLKSIKESIKKDGNLYLFEPLKNKKDSRFGCPKIMEKNKIYEFLVNNGFTVVAEEYIRDWVLLKCIVN